MSLEALVDVAGLGRRFPGGRGVADVALTIAPGEIVGLVGANGGGKTTTLRLLGGLLLPDAGGGRVLGGDVSQLSSGRRRQTGYMSQRLGLYDDLSVAENLRFRAGVLGLAPGAVVAAIDRFGLGPVTSTRAAVLSGGWGRRVQFAATVIGAPALLLLDEPTAGLDVATRRQIWTWLGELAARGHGIVISTHDLHEAERCDTLLVYREGVAGPQQTLAALLHEHGAPTLESAIERLAA